MNINTLVKNLNHYDDNNIKVNTQSKNFIFNNEKKQLIFIDLIDSKMQSDKI